MEYSVFVKLARDELNQIYDLLHASEFAGDFDLINDILYIYSQAGEYVVNMHSPTSQIWLSSPVSSAGYFSYDASKAGWFNKENQSLRDRVLSELI
jgi:frataxin-like iron-binding protein CyaY